MFSKIVFQNRILYNKVSSHLIINGWIPKIAQANSKLFANYTRRSFCKNTQADSSDFSDFSDSEPEVYEHTPMKMGFNNAKKDINPDFLSKMTQNSGM